MGGSRVSACPLQQVEAQVARAFLNVTGPLRKKMVDGKRLLRVRASERDRDTERGDGAGGEERR